MIFLLKRLVSDFRASTQLTVANMLINFFKTRYLIVSTLLAIIGGTLFFINKYTYDYSINGHPSDRASDRYEVDRISNTSSYENSNDHLTDKLIDNKTKFNVMPGYTRPVTADTEWIRDLYYAVKQLTGRQVTLLMSNINYLNLLINWLAHSVLHASQPVNSILIIALDSPTHRVLQHRGFHSVYIPPRSVVSPGRNFKSVGGIWATRLMIMRLLNYWNYSVLAFDIDAIMLKNIQSLLDKFNTSDIIGSSGTYPFNLSKKWNVPTLCMGVILIKSSPATGTYIM